MRIGFVGFGEAAYELSKGLKNHNNASIRAYDLLLEQPIMREKLIEKAETTGVKLSGSLKELITCKLDILIVAVPANKALEVSSKISEFLEEDTLYIDISASTPEIQKEINQLLEPITNFYVDASILGPLTKFKQKVPIMVSGNGADEFIRRIEGFDMNITKISNRAGDASAIKLIRSIFMKGMASLAIETLEIGREMGVDKHVVNSLNATLDNEDLNDTIKQLVTGTSIHSERRSVELEGSISLLKNLNINSEMSQGILKKLKYVTDFNLREFFNADRPDSWETVIDTMSKLKNDK